MIAALRLAEPSWHHHPATAGRDDGGGRESFDGRGGRDEPGGGDVGGPVRIGSEREELYKMYSDHIEVPIGCFGLLVHSPLFSTGQCSSSERQWLSYKFDPIKDSDAGSVSFRLLIEVCCSVGVNS